ncbi:hypothetical protein ABOM_003792 [Aspergillus bombycis]|uniref:Cyclase n=1 Tax=Aspergillus bombycis TaxID=109264 RepID=A0A1F8A6B0_9EURO|nr:hypothetical protein ABOM_003792 [Aspergillus bombycis]OGM47292.1 hypothetical protein ABOM_003792 [Aspergillus bombycis]
MDHFPAYEDLPTVTFNGQPKRCAWGIFDKNGTRDVYGCLNKVTTDVVVKAAAEVKDGVTISLNCPLRLLRTPAFGRRQLTHKVISFVDSPLQIHGFDDELEFNTQCSSQWDALCHFYDQDIKRGYNNANPTIEDLSADHIDATRTSIPTLEHWHTFGGLATRGVLIDYKAYADRNGIKYSPVSPHKITISEIEKIATEQGVIFQPGDVFLLRTGYTEAIQAATEDEQAQMIDSPDNAGVEGTLDAVRWFWNHHFSAVAGDNLGFEVMRPSKNGIDATGSTADYVLHPHFLSLLGLHIGELWDLKSLSEYCHRKGRFTFMLTSMPLNFAGACGSPPNAMALF